MKKILLLSTLFLLVLKIYSQPTVERKKDEFTKMEWKQTSYEKIVQTWTKTFFVNVIEKDSVKILHLKMSLPKSNNLITIGEHLILMFKLKNDSIITLYNIEKAYSCRGCGAIGFIGSEAPGIEASYGVLPSVIDYLKTNPIVKIRVYTDDGFIEEDVADKRSNILQQLLALIDKK